MKESKPHRERNGASLKPRASALPYALDTAVVVIDRMTKLGRSEHPQSGRNSGTSGTSLTGHFHSSYVPGRCAAEVAGYVERS